MYSVYNIRVNLCIMLLVFVVCCLLFVNSSVPSEHGTGTQWLCGDVSSEVLEAPILQQFCYFNPLLVTVSLVDSPFSLICSCARELAVMGSLLLLIGRKTPGGTNFSKIPTLTL